MMKRLLALSLIVVALTGCNDLLGMTSREQARTDAVVASGNSSARIAEAYRDTVVAEQNAAVERSRIDAQTHAFDSALEAAKPDYLPIYLALALLGGIAIVAVYWMGRSHYANVSNGSMTPQYRLAGDSMRNRLLREWHDGNYRQGEDGQYYIVMEGRKYRALLPGGEEQ